MLTRENNRYSLGVQLKESWTEDEEVIRITTALYLWMRANPISDRFPRMVSPNWKKPRASWRALRELAGLTCEDVAQRLNVDRTTVQRWELGQRNPDSPRKYRTVLEEMEDEALFGLELIILAAGLVTESRAMDLSPTDYIDHIETNGGIPALALRLSTKEVPAMWQGPT